MKQDLSPGDNGSLADVIDRILDKGVVINADITVSVIGVELLGLKIRAAVASFETAARYGLEFPSGTELPEWAGSRTALTGHEQTSSLIGAFHGQHELQGAERIDGQAPEQRI